MAIILLNAAQEEELRIAILDENKKIRDLVFEHPGKEEKINNLYLGVITGIEPSLNAVFVNYGADRHGFLPIKDISPVSFYRDVLGKDSALSEKPIASSSFKADSDVSKGDKKISEVSEKNEDQKADSAKEEKEGEKVEAASSAQLEVKVEDLKVGQELIVQVDKEERGNKGAALTNQISLAGRYLVLMPDNASAGGISRRVEGEDREGLKDYLKQLKKPDGMGVIIRTSGVNKTLEELQWDLDMLLEQWGAIKQASVKKKAPFLIFQESGVVSRILRDYLSHDIEKIIVDTPEIYKKLKEHIDFVRPKFSEKLSLYAESTPIFNQYNIESQIETVYQTSVRLDSGASIVINPTEALVAIDVNSARATRGSDIEETALQINLDAADEIARQLRLRDLGGLIVIDFIDMSSTQHQKEVEARLRAGLRTDRARVQMTRISRFGLLEMSRQRLKSSLSEETQVTCPRCKGEGRIRSIQSIALSILRVIEEDAIKGQISKVQLQLPVEIATFFLNEKRTKLAEIEKKYSMEVVILPNLNFHVPHYQIRREKLDKDAIEARKKAKSHEEIASYEEVKVSDAETPRKKTQQPAVEFVASRPAPMPKSETPGLLKRLFAGMFSSAAEQEAPKVERKRRTSPHSGGGNKPRGGGRGRSGSGSGGSSAGPRGRRPQGGGDGARRSGGGQKRGGGNRSRQPSQRGQSSSGNQKAKE